MLASLGIPIEASGFVIGLYPFQDMLNTMSNTTGDVATAVIVARSEGLLDCEKYNS